MPNVSEKKKKLLVLLQIFLEKTDADHALTLPQLLDELESRGIPAERKSIYDDIETLRSVGVEIGTRKTKTFQYYVEKRRFSADELQLLLDAVTAAPFLSDEQSGALAEKLMGLCSVHQAASLRRRASAPAGVREMDDSVLDGAEIVHRAITEDRQIRFQLLEWRLSSAGKPELTVKKGVKALTVSPWRMSMEGDRCVLWAYDGALKKLRCFRLDQITQPEVLPFLRETPFLKEGGEAAGEVPVTRAKEKIALEFPAELLGQVVEQFGDGFSAEPVGKNRIRASLRAEPGPELFSWLFAHGTEIRLAAPKKLMEQYRERTKAVAKLYKS